MSSFAMRQFPYRTEKGWASVMKCLPPTEMDLPLLNPGVRRRDKDALSNHMANYGLKDAVRNVILTSFSSLSRPPPPTPRER